MSTITIWLITVVSSTGQPIELAHQYDSAQECVSAVAAIQSEHAGIRASCAARTIAVPEERARQRAIEEWWRNQPPEAQSIDKRKP